MIVLLRLIHILAGVLWVGAAQKRATAAANARREAIGNRRNSTRPS